MPLHYLARLKVFAIRWIHGGLVVNSKSLKTQS